jgi:hypothetical protein
VLVEKQALGGAGKNYNTISTMNYEIFRASPGAFDWGMHDAEVLGHSALRDERVQEFTLLMSSATPVHGFKPLLLPIHFSGTNQIDNHVAGLQL